MTVLAIDQGTSGTKAIVVDGTDVLAVEEVSIRPEYLAGGGVEIDPDQLLQSVLTAGRRAVAAAGRPISAVGLANQGETVLAWDRNTGRPLSAAIGWQDRRSEPICTELAEHRELFARRTGLTLDPYFSAPKMTWLRRNVTREGVVTTTDSWLVHQLTGQFVTDVTTAGRSLVFDLDELRWQPDLLQLFGLPDEELPLVLANDETAGETAAFGGDIPVAGLVVDQQAALFGQGCLTVGSAKCTLGTGAFLLANTGPVGVRSATGLTSSPAWRLGGATSYCLDGQVYTAGSAIRWLCRLGLLGSPADLDEVAAPDADGVIFVPALAGLAAPWWRPEASASFTGMTLSTGRGELVRAVVDGIAAQIAELATLVGVECGAPLQRLRVDGGLTASTVVLQALADLLQIPVDVHPSPHATALGVAALARIGTEPGLRIPDALGDLRPVRSFRPEWSTDRAATFLAGWRTAIGKGSP